MRPEDQNPVLSDHKNAAFNAFLMMRFADRPVNREIRQGLEKALARYAIQLLRADQKAYSASLWENVRSYMNACHFGVAVFEQVVETDYNPNVSLELCYMLAQGKRLLLLKERRCPGCLLILWRMVKILERAETTCDGPTRSERPWKDVTRQFWTL
jgi:hypothetical protein